MNYIITGGHSGMGLELTNKLLAEDHKVALIVRSESRKEEARMLFSNETAIDIFVADLSNRNDIAQVADQIGSELDKIDGLFNNAGLLLDQLYMSDYGNELQLEVNAISPYILTKALLPLLEKGDNSFVVNTATSGLDSKETIDIPTFKRPKKFTKLLGSYIDSKLILVLLMNHLSKKSKSVRFVSVNPGAIKTKMTAGKGMPFWLKPIRNIFFKAPVHGANNLYDAAFNPKYQQSGIFISKGKIRPMKLEINQEQIDQLLTYKNN